MGRAWLPGSDPALAQAECNLQANRGRIQSMTARPSHELQTYKDSTTQQLPQDIMTSLNLQAGMHRLHPAETGLFRRVRQDVTLLHNRAWSKK